MAREKWEDSFVFQYAGTHHRVRIFVDFWNLFNSASTASRDKTAIDYDLLLQMIFKKCSPGDKRFEGGCVYVSNLDANSGAKRVIGKLERLRGIEVKKFDTKTKKRKCPHCQKDVDQREEKGADVALVTDMISHAWNGSYDLGVVVSADSDFKPAVEFLQTRGIKIVTACFNNDCSLAKTAWGRLDLSGYWDFWGIK